MILPALYYNQVLASAWIREYTACGLHYNQSCGSSKGGSAIRKDRFWPTPLCHLLLQNSGSRRRPKYPFCSPINHKSLLLSWCIEECTLNPVISSHVKVTCLHSDQLIRSPCLGISSGVDFRSHTERKRAGKLALMIPVIHIHRMPLALLRDPSEFLSL